MEGQFFAGKSRRMLVGLVVTIGCGILFPCAAWAVGTPSQQGAVNALQQAQVVVHTYTKPTAVITRAGSTCWGEIRDRYSLVFHGVTIAWAEVDQEGWCGNNTRITWQGGATYPKFHSFPYCWADDDTSDTWLDYPAWRHAENTRQIGVPTAFGCIGLRTIHAHLRYGANGYWDRLY
jgi:hypothetical protein